VDRRQWIAARDFEDAIAAVNLLPGPASTQLSIYCANRLRGRLGALVGGLCFIVPGLVLILVLAALFLADDPPRALEGAGLGAGAAVAAVAVRAGLDLIGPSWRRAGDEGRRGTLLLLVAVGALAAAAIGPWLVVVLLGCGVVSLAARRRTAVAGVALPLAASVLGSGLAWTALKVGALSYGGGFVIIPLMQGDAVDAHHWMTDAQFLNAVALGQVTPGPVVQTVAVVGYAVGGVGAGLLAALIAFSPSFLFIMIGADRFHALLGNRDARAFIDGAAPAALGAILGSAVPLALALDHGWQVALLAAAAVALLVLKQGVVAVLVAAGAAGALIHGLS
jgi:chromate transporter